MGKWVEWSGGSCPVSSDEVVEIELRCGILSNDKARCFMWDHHGGDGDIIRYRVVDDEADCEPDTPAKTLRDEFAMAALGGLLGRSWDHLNLDDKALFSIWAEGAYTLADAMLAARKESE